MIKAISAVKTYPNALPMPHKLIDFDVAVAAEDGPVIVLVQARDEAHAIDKINGMPDEELEERIEFERMIARRVAAAVHGR